MFDPLFQRKPLFQVKRELVPETISLNGVHFVTPYFLQVSRIGNLTIWIPTFKLAEKEQNSVHDPKK